MLYLSIYSYRTGYFPADMIATISDNPRPVANIYEEGSLTHVNVLLYLMSEHILFIEVLLR